MASFHAPPPPPPPPPPSSHNNAVQIMDLTASSQAQRAEHEARLKEMAIQTIAARLTTVPTLPADVRDALRQRGQPVRLFGEHLADIRQRLRMVLAQQEYEQQQQTTTAVGDEAELEDEEQVTKYTRASAEWIEARQAIAKFSLQRAKERLERERQLRELALNEKRQKQEEAQQRKKQRLLAQDNSTKEEEDKMDVEAVEGETNDASPSPSTILTRLDDDCQTQYQSLKQVGLQGSQYGDSRALSSVCTAQLQDGRHVCVTGSWTSSLQMWELPSMTQLAEHTLCHQDRIMAMDLMMIKTETAEDSMLVATASIDRTAKLWKLQATNVVEEEEEKDTEMNEDNNKEKAQKDASPAPLPFTATELHHLQGHQARLCRTAFHPMQRHVATTSFDHSWRLWDVETGQNLLLQDGHAGGVFGLGFHPDGSLCATTDIKSVVQLWDLRTGKSIHHFTGQHAKRILCAAFSPSNGFQLATAGDDGTIKIFDLRRRKIAVSIPAHSRLVSQLQFSTQGDGSEYLVSSSFDGTAKIWSTRAEWKWLNTLTGHEGKVSSVGILRHNQSKNVAGIVTCGFDKTLKYWL